MCTQLLERYNAEGEAFLQRILTGDESWVYHYDPESKAQSMECRHKTSPSPREFKIVAFLSPREFKVVASARKVLFTVFWDMERVVHMEFLEQGPDLAPSDYYLFAQLKKYLKGHNYDNDEEVIADVRRWCRGQSFEFFADGVRQLAKRWRLC
ncbi:transposase [Plakobranchus ocellatus]|uniref:Transposase n=1 Tax=Plakobranchus ocellatus TaxID=259542 RepID=A0AAV4DZ27_9GAST|nr:transposase [Plakobranchus ocellatus]